VVVLPTSSPNLTTSFSHLIGTTAPLTGSRSLARLRKAKLFLFRLAGHNHPSRCSISTWYLVGLSHLIIILLTRPGPRDVFCLDRDHAAVNSCSAVHRCRIGPLCESISGSSARLGCVEKVAQAVGEQHTRSHCPLTSWAIYQEKSVFRKSRIQSVLISREYRWFSWVRPVKMYVLCGCRWNPNCQQMADRAPIRPFIRTGFIRRRYLITKMPTPSAVTQMRLNNIIICLNAVVTTVEVISTHLDTPFLKPIVTTMWSLLTTVQVLFVIQVAREMTNPG
jgi:hypothetical protein